MGNETFQTVAALVLSGSAAAWLLWRAWTFRENPGCGDDCACPAEKFRRKSKQQHRRL